MRTVRTVCVIMALGVGVSATAEGAAADPARWRLQQPAAPAPPAGVDPAPFPVPLGHIGDIAFAAPNRGALVTTGHGPVPAGVYAYDGGSWHQLATVCGAFDGAVAWAGPNDLWTVADARVGQTLPAAVSNADRSLCHFAGGRVVASYAEPLNRPESYQDMNAAACRSAADCWFAGALLPTPPPYGAFHARWDGQWLTAVPSPAAPVNNDPAHEVRDIVVHQGTYVESVRITAEDPVNPAAPDAPGAVAWLHLITDDLTNPFVPVPITVDLGRTPANAAIKPTDLDGFALSSDGDRLWAVAGATRTQRANVVALQMQPSGSFKQLKLIAALGVTGALPYGSKVIDIAAEPGAGAVWVAFQAPDVPEDVAQVARIDGAGTVTRVDTLPTGDDPVGPKGAADQIACPALNDCWLATDDGWLFHLSDGTSFGRDTDPSWAGVITNRPADGGTPFEQPLELPIDDALANAQTAPPASLAPPAPGELIEPKTGARAKKLVSKVTTKLVKHTTKLRVTFQLAVKARVTVLAKRRGKTVAKSKATMLKPGRRTLTVRLNRRRWPTALSVDVKPVATRGAAVAAVAAPGAPAARATGGAR